MGKDVIIALDFDSREKTLAFLDQFTDRKPFVKIGMELFYAEGPSIVREIKARGHQIFLDLPHSTHGSAVVITDLCQKTCFLFNVRHAHPVQTIRTKRCTKDVICFTDNHFTGLRTNLCHNDRSSHGKSKPFPLTNGIMRDSLMLSDHSSVCPDKISFWNLLSRVLLNELCIISIRDKTDLLAVRLMSHWKTQLFCKCADLILGVLSHWHQCF